MKSRFTQFLMCIITFLIVFALGIIGMILFQEFFSEETNVENNGEIGVITQDESFLDDSFLDKEEKQEKTEYIRDNTELSVDSTGTKSKKYTNANNLIENTQENEITINKYFYNQLNEYSKAMYKAFEKNKEQMKTGTYQVDFGDKFSSVLRNSNGQDTLGNYYQSAIEAYIYDNPDVFYLNPTNMYLNVETTTKGNSKTYNVFVNNGDKANYLIDEFNSKSEVDLALSKLEYIRNRMVSQSTGNTYHDIKMVHDYLVDNIQYDKSLSGENIYNIYGALINNRCVCEGYAKSFKYILDGMGIECTLVIGKATNSAGESENHAWNYVKLGGNFYAVDTTWDDPIVVGGSATPEMRYKYFLKGRSEMQADHFPSGKFTEDGMEFSYPTLSYNSYE